MATSYQQYTWPPIDATTSSPSTGPTGSPVPAEADYVAGVDGSGILRGLSVTSAGILNVNLSSETTSPLATSDAADGPVSPGTIASKSILIGAEYLSSLPTLLTGQQAALQADSSGRLLVGSIASALPAGTNNLGSITNITGTVSLPTGASTSALQTQISAQLPATLGAHVTAASLAVNIASDQTVPVSLSSVPLPTGAATAANQTNASQKTQIVDGSGNVIASTSNALNVDVTASALPTGAATSALQTTGNTSLSSIVTNTADVANTTGATGSALPSDAILIGVKNGSNMVAIAEGQAVMASSLPVVIASDQSSIPTSPASSTGRSVANAPVYNVYSSTNITTSAYVQLIASTSNTTNHLSIFDSSGNGMILGVGGSGSEVIQLYVAPGGGEYDLAIPAGSRVAYKALTANSTSGYLLMNLLK